MYDHHTDHPEAAGKVIHILTLHFFAWVWEIQVLTAFAFGVPLLVNPTHALYCVFFLSYSGSQTAVTITI